MFDLHADILNGWKNMLYIDNAMEPFTMQNTSRSEAHGLCFVVVSSPLN